MKLIITTPLELKALINELFVEHAIKAKTSKSLVKPLPDGRRYYTRKETAKELNITLPTLTKYVKEGRINSHRIGSRILFKVEDIETALVNRKFK